MQFLFLHALPALLFCSQCRVRFPGQNIPLNPMPGLLLPPRALTQLLQTPQAFIPEEITQLSQKAALNIPVLQSSHSGKTKSASPPQCIPHLPQPILGFLPGGKTGAIPGELGWELPVSHPSDHHKSNAWIYLSKEKDNPGTGISTIS